MLQKMSSSISLAFLAVHLLLDWTVECKSPGNESRLLINETKDQGKEYKIVCYLVSFISSNSENSSCKLMLSIIFSWNKGHSIVRDHGLECIIVSGLDCNGSNSLCALDLSFVEGERQQHVVPDGVRT